MAETIEITLPSRLVERMGGTRDELPKRAYEAVVAQLYRTGKLSYAEVSSTLGLNRIETDGFLKSAKAFRDDHDAELEKDFETLQKFLK